MSEVPEWEEVSEESGHEFKPTMTQKAKDECERGNPLPLMAVHAGRGSDVSIVEADIQSNSISGNLKDLMLMPSGYVVNGVACNNSMAIASTLMGKAMAGDMAAIREVLNRTEGKTPSRTERLSANVSVKGDANSISALMARIDKNKTDKGA